MKAKTTTLERLSVQKKEVKFGHYKGTSRWFVCMDECPCGEMLDFFQAGELKHPFPFRSGQDGSVTQKGAEDLLCDMKLHIREAVAKLPSMKSGRVGNASFKHWSV